MVIRYHNYYRPGIDTSLRTYYSGEQMIVWWPNGAKQCYI